MAKKEGPDQPRSWIIAMAACVINTMLSGISRATGIFYVALIESYGVTRMEANMPFTVRNSVRNLAGPIVGIIGQKYGVCLVSVIGGALAVLGVSLCSVAPNITWISIFWGGFHGLGVALGNTLFQVTVNQYFVKYRATAAGIALSGACVGAFVFPVVIEKLVSTYGLPGAFLLTSGLIMQVLPAAILLREPPWLKTQFNTSSNIKDKTSTSSCQTTEASKSLEISRLQKIEFITGHKLTDTKRDDSKSVQINGIRKFSSNENFNMKTKNPDHFIKGSVASLPTTGIDNPNFKDSTIRLNEETKEQVLELQLPQLRIRTLSAGEVSLTVPCETVPSTEKRSMWKYIISVYSNPMFHLISISLATFGTLYDPIVTVIVDYIKDKGLEENVGKYFISILSLGDLLGRLCFGWVTDKNYLTLPKFILVNLLIQGVCILMLPMFYSFEALMGVIFIYGVAAGTTIVMFPLLVGKYLASEQSLAIGCINFFGGLTAFTVPVLIGHFRDYVGSYDGMFYIMGGMAIVTSLLWTLEPFLVKLNCKRTITKDSNTT